MEPVTVIVWIFVAVFLLTAVITLGGIVENVTFIKVPDKYLKGLYAALLLEIVGASITVGTGALNQNQEALKIELEKAKKEIRVLRSQLNGTNSSVSDTPSMNDQSTKLYTGPPLSECKFGTIGLNMSLQENVEREICHSNAPRGEISIEPERNINGVTNILKWHVFDSTGTRPVAICLCYK